MSMSNYDATPGMSPSTAGGGMNLEVWFPQQDEVSVWLESSFTDPDEERMYEAMLFALFAARHLANDGSSPASQMLGQVLFSLDERKPRAEVLTNLHHVKLVSPNGRGGRKGFSCEFRPEKRAFFKLHLHGFGLLGKGMDYYAPWATIALLAWLLDRRQDDARYQLALGMAAKMVGAAAVSGQISVRTQSDIAIQAASAGWMHPDDMLPEGAELPDEVIQACRENEIEFGPLFAGASSRLQEAIERNAPGRDPDSIQIFHDDDTKRICRNEVAMAAGLLGDESPLESAAQLVEAAEATEDENQIAGAYGYYDQQLADQLDARGLLPVAEQLEDMLFESNTNEAE